MVEFESRFIFYTQSNITVGMHRNTLKCMYRALLIIVMFTPGVFAADSVYYVNQGISFFEAKDYAAALVAFDEAEKIAPNDLRITFNQACALWGSKKTDEAIEKFRKTAFAKDRNLAADSLFNIGSIYVARAVSYLADPPANTSQLRRDQSFAELEIAEKEFSDCLIVDPKRTDARKTLESIRTWKDHIENAWTDRDKNVKWNENSFSDYLMLLEKEQWSLRKQLQDEHKQPNTPKKYQSFFIASKIQSRLAGEASDLRKKIETTPLENLFPQSSKYTTGEEMEETVRIMLSQTDAFAQNASDSAAKLRDYSVESALKSQQKAIESLDNIQTIRKNYEMLVRDAVDLQEMLVSQSRLSELDVPEHVWRQSFVKRFVDAFLEKASDESTKIESDILRNQNFDDTDESENDMFREIDKSDDELLLDSMKLALEFGPEIMELLHNIPLQYDQGNRENASQIQEKLRVKLNRILEPLEEKTEQSHSQDTNESESNSDSQPDTNPQRQDADTANEDSNASDENAEQSDEESSMGSDELDEKQGENNENGSDQSKKEDPINDSTNEKGTKSNPNQPTEVSEPNAELNESKSAEISTLPESENDIEKINADTLIRNIKRRHQEAEKIRLQLRRLTEPNRKDPKDW